MSKLTYEMVQRFIDQEMKSITLKWIDVDPAWKTLIHERIINANFQLKSDDGIFRRYEVVEYKGRC